MAERLKYEINRAFSLIYIVSQLTSRDLRITSGCEFFRTSIRSSSGSLGILLLIENFWVRFMQRGDWEEKRSFKGSNHTPPHRNPKLLVAILEEIQEFIAK
jgi:hypothetical protein